MDNLFLNITCSTWLVLAVIMFCGLMKWNKRFSELYDELKQQLMDDPVNMDGKDDKHGL